MNRSSNNTPVPPNNNDADTNNDRRRPNVVQEACHYTILNLPHDATASHVQRNFKYLSRSYHPDKLSTTTSATTGISSPISSIDAEDLEENSQLAVTERNELMSLLYQQQQQRRFALAQSTFVRLKTAADVLSDPVYRLAYTYGGNIAVMLIKRSQATRQAQSAATEDAESFRSEGNHDDDEENQNSVDLYTLLEQHVNDHPKAADIIADFVQEYRIQQEQLQSSPSPLKLSCSMPLVVVESITPSSLCDVSFVQRESATTRVSSKHAMNHRLSTTWSAISEVQRTAQIKVSGALSLDYQLAPGTRFTSELTLPLAGQSTTSRGSSKPTLSLQTTRQTKSGTVMVVMMGGNATRRGVSSWNTTFMSSKLLLWESLWGSPRQQPTSSAREEPIKVVATWRLSCNPRGQLGFFMAGLKRLDFPSWACRLCLGTYPLKISWRGDETDTFYATYSLGMFASRVKLVRIASWDHVLGYALPQSWTATYGFKYDGQAGISGRTPWSLLCHVQSDSMSFRIPIVLDTVRPISWLISVVVALFVDHHFESFVGALWRPPDETSQRSGKKPRTVSVDHDRPWSDVIHRIAVKKRELESSRPDGLVIHHAFWSDGKKSKDRDMKDTLQYWIANGKLGPMSLKDSRLWWNSNPPQVERTNSSSSNDPERSWWNIWSRNPDDDDIYTLENASDMDAIGDSFCSFTIRYQYHDMMYEIYLTRIDVIELPHRNATELGPANRIS